MRYLVFIFNCAKVNTVQSVENVNLENYPFADENFSISEETTNLIVNEINQLKNIQSHQKVRCSRNR